ncbi:MAG: methionyl-tRNA formyltransferase [Candidatus Pacebacteria bacterium]|nr:methionyl-tRNA formyltransferase [Candidatus Paceibacterota bacterium]
MSNIVFFGTPSFALPALRALAKSPFRPIAVVTTLDKPLGRKKTLTPSPIALEAELLGIPALKLPTLKDDASWAQFEALKADVCIVVAYGNLIPQKYLASTPHGWLNIHPSLLPKLRGPSPVATAIQRGISDSGVSIMLIDDQQDHGPILARQAWTITSTITTPEAEREASELGAQLLLDVLPRYLTGEITPRPQNDTEATFTKKFTREDGRINWNLPAQDILNHIRALGHNPGTWTTWDGKTLNVVRAHVSQKPATTPGNVDARGPELRISCADTHITIDELQLEGSTRQNAADFLRGRSAIDGACMV